MIVRAELDENTKAIADVSDRWTLKEFRAMRESDEEYRRIANKKTKSLAVEFIDDDEGRVAYNGVDEVFDNLENLDCQIYAFVISYLPRAVDNLFLSGRKNTEVS